MTTPTTPIDEMPPLPVVAYLRTAETMGSPVVSKEFVDKYPEHKFEFDEPLCTVSDAQAHAAQRCAALAESYKDAFKDGYTQGGIGTALHTQPASAVEQPVAHQFQTEDGQWHNFDNDAHRNNTISDGRWPIRALSVISTAKPTAQPCQHSIADVRNPVVKSGYMCVKCGALFSAADHDAATPPPVAGDAPIAVELRQRFPGAWQAGFEGRPLADCPVDELQAYLAGRDAASKQEGV